MKKVTTSDKLLKHLEERRKKRDYLKSTLAEEYGVEDNPKLDDLFRLAWSHGHSGGDNEVEFYFSEFVTLIQ